MRVVPFVRILVLMLISVFASGHIEATGVNTSPSPAPAIDFNHLPWTDGEALTYLVCLSTFEAAEGTFVARKKGDHWEFKLSLKSRGLVDDFYPFSGTFWSIVDTSPWRSLEYGEYRFEPGRTIKERTRIDYHESEGTRENWMDGKAKTFPIAEDAVDDLGSMLYHLRVYAWRPGDKRTLYVYESNSEKQAEAECQGVEMRAFGTWPRQPLLRILLLPTNGTHRRGRLMLWMTDDARHLPIHAELAFRYGSFSIDLTKAEKMRPAKP